MTALHTKGVQIKRAGTAIGDVVSISGPDGQATVIDATDLDSTFVEKIQGLPDGGSVSCVADYNPGDAQQAALQTDWAGQVTAAYDIAVPSTPALNLTFNGWCLQYAPQIDANNKVVLNFVILVQGVVTRTTTP